VLHRLAKRQLKNLKLDPETPPSLEVWQQFLERVSQTYLEAERDKYLLERSLTISSREMQDLYENLRRSSETQLAQERDKLQAVVSAVGDGLCALDQAGQLIFINPAGEQLLGWPEAELIGRSLLDLIEALEPDKPATATAGLYHLISAGQPYRHEDSAFKRKDGTVFPTSYVLNPIMNEGILAGSVLVFRDITRRKQTELELEQYREQLEEQVAKRTVELTAANDQLQQEIAERKRTEAALAQAHEQALEANRLKTQLLANVSHDLRTPLGAILGYSEMLEEGMYGPLTDRQLNAVLEIVDSTDQLLNFVNNLLSQAQIEVGRLTLNQVGFEPARLLEEVQSMFGSSAKAKGLVLTGDIASDVPSILSGDPYWLRQILVNLVGNAVKFTQAGSVAIHIGRPDPGHWALRVSDTGDGIPAEAQTYIFEPFRQVDGTATRNHAGSGLGLSIVKQLTHLMGGELILESQLGQGSTFTIVLDLQPAEAKVT
jgi:PAS domain S-box-containing protein